MISTSELPAVNAALNALSAACLTAGFVFIRRKNVTAHRVCMLSAFCVSVVFLICYATYHALHGSTRFTHPGAVRRVYFAVLISHVVLAAAIVPLVMVTLVRALRGHVDRHRAVARWAWPIWMYVSITGVVVYLMLYRWYPAA